MSTEENKAAERRFYAEVWAKRNLAAIDELVTPNVIEHNPNVPSQGPGCEGFRQSIEMILSTSPDVRITIEDLIAEGDKVVVRWMARGTHQGEFMGIPPTNKQVTVMGIDILRYAGASGSRPGASGTPWASCSRSARCRQQDSPAKAPTTAHARTASLVGCGPQVRMCFCVHRREQGDHASFR